jgi:chromosome segregation ATPase
MGKRSKGKKGKEKVAVKKIVKKGRKDASQPEQPLPQLQPDTPRGLVPRQSIPPYQGDFEDVGRDITQYLKPGEVLLSDGQVYPASEVNLQNLNRSRRPNDLFTKRVLVPFTANEFSSWQSFLKKAYRFDKYPLSLSTFLQQFGIYIEGEVHDLIEKREFPYDVKSIPLSTDVFVDVEHLNKGMRDNTIKIWGYTGAQAAQTQHELEQQVEDLFEKLTKAKDALSELGDVGEELEATKEELARYANCYPNPESKEGKDLLTLSAKLEDAQGQLTLIEGDITSGKYVDKAQLIDAKKEIVRLGEKNLELKNRLQSAGQDEDEEEALAQQIAHEREEFEAGLEERYQQALEEELQKRKGQLESEYQGKFEEIELTKEEQARVLEELRQAKALSVNLKRDKDNLVRQNSELFDHRDFLNEEYGKLDRTCKNYKRILTQLYAKAEEARKEREKEGIERKIEGDNNE